MLAWLKKKLSSWPGLVLMVLGAVGFVIALATLSTHPQFKDWLNEFTVRASQAGLRGWVFYILAYVISTLLLIPGSLLTLGGAYAFGFWLALALVTIAANIGATLAFLIGRYFFRGKIVERLEKGGRLHAIDVAIQREGWKVVLLLRLSPVVPFCISNYLLGLTGVRFWPYFWSSFFGMFPGSLFYVYLGYAGRAMVQNPSGGWVWFWRVIGLLATVITVWILARAAKKALQDVLKGDYNRPPSDN